MRMSKITLILAVTASFLFCQKQDPQTQTNPDQIHQNTETALGKNEWRVVAAVPADEKKLVLKVFYTDEIGFVKDSVYCTAVFESNTQYRLVAPWISKHTTLQKTNVLKSEITTVPRSEMK